MNSERFKETLIEIQELASAGLASDKEATVCAEIFGFIRGLIWNGIVKDKDWELEE